MENKELYQQAIETICSSIQYMVEQLKQTSTQIYGGVITGSGSNGIYPVMINGKTFSLPVYPSKTLEKGNTVKVIIPQGNMNLAFILG